MIDFNESDEGKRIVLLEATINELGRYLAPFVQSENLSQSTIDVVVELREKSSTQNALKVCGTCFHWQEWEPRGTTIHNYGQCIFGLSTQLPAWVSTSSPFRKVHGTDYRDKCKCWQRDPKRGGRQNE